MAEINVSEAAKSLANFSVVTDWPILTTIICGFMVLLAWSTVEKILAAGW